MLSEGEALARIAEKFRARAAGLARRSLSHARKAVASELRKAERAAGAKGVRLACRGAGCNGCCRGDVAVTPREFDALVAVVPESQWAHIRAQRPVDGPDCPLLDPTSGACSVYHQRPLACRAHHSLSSDPDHCWPERSGVRDIPRIAEPLALAVAIHKAEIETRSPPSGGTIVNAEPLVLAGLIRRSAHEREHARILNTCGS